MQGLKVNSRLVFQDVWGLDPDLLAMIPRPCGAVILLFPITDSVNNINQYEETRCKRNERLQQEGQIISEELVFIPQTIGNACGTIGLFHALANTKQYSDLGDGPFAKFLEKIKGKPWSDIPAALEQDEVLANIHHER